MSTDYVRTAGAIENVFHWRKTLKRRGMSNHFIPRVADKSYRQKKRLLVPLVNSTKFAIIATTFLIVLVGCRTPDPDGSMFNDPRAAHGTNVAQLETIVLREGDSVKISFPGAPNLNTVQTIRRDGMITLQAVGEFKATGLTPPAMEKALIELYGPQLQTKEVTVAVESSAYQFYVIGAVAAPGKKLTDHPLTLLEALMEAGGFDPGRANLKAVRVIRRENGKDYHYKFNLKPVWNGGQSEPFTVKPSDIIYVPERFSWF